MRIDEKYNGQDAEGPFQFPLIRPILLSDHRRLHRYGITILMPIFRDLIIESRIITWRLGTDIAMAFES
jgi:hypothetical protein